MIIPLTEALRNDARKTRRRSFGALYPDMIIVLPLEAGRGKVRGAGVPDQRRLWFRSVCLTAKSVPLISTMVLP